jgi:NAD(P)-dependent dehydrogenase (short-subunit alcohol dehydrogenase family)
MTGSTMDGARVLVVGASAGIGRVFAEAAADAGARVVAVARRDDRLQALKGVHPVAADVTSHDGRAAIAAGCREHLGQLDLVLYAAGRAELYAVEDSDGDAWHATLETNVVAYNRLVAALLPLLDPGSIVAALSSEAAINPLSGLVVYSASKAALESSVRGWLLEHPEVRFSVVGVGVTQPTEFGLDFDLDAVVPYLKQWRRRGQFPSRAMDTGELVAVLVALFGTALRNPTISVEHIALRPLSDAPAS